jgi:hypothetical protein
MRNESQAALHPVTDSYQDTRLYQLTCSSVIESSADANAVESDSVPPHTGSSNECKILCACMWRALILCSYSNITRASNVSGRTNHCHFALQRWRSCGAGVERERIRRYSMLPCHSRTLITVNKKRAQAELTAHTIRQRVCTVAVHTVPVEAHVLGLQARR